MNVTKITTIDYDNILDSNSTNDYIIFTNNIIVICTNNENNMDIKLSTLKLTNPCGWPFLCLMSLMMYTLTKPLIINK